MAPSIAFLIGENDPDCPEVEGDLLPPAAGTHASLGKTWAVHGQCRWGAHEKTQTLKMQKLKSSWLEAVDEFGFVDLLSFSTFWIEISALASGKKKMIKQRWNWKDVVFKGHPSCAAAQRSLWSISCTEDGSNPSPKIRCSPNVNSSQTASFGCVMRCKFP